jgi:hypothetical protein
MMEQQTRPVDYDAILNKLEDINAKKILVVLCIGENGKNIYAQKITIPEY